MDPNRGTSIASTTTARFPPIAARGGSFLPPVSQPPTRPISRRPSVGSSSLLPTPLASPSPHQSGLPSPGASHPAASFSPLNSKSSGYHDRDQHLNGSIGGRTGLKQPTHDAAAAATSYSELGVGKPGSLPTSLAPFQQQQQKQQHSAYPSGPYEANALSPTHTTYSTDKLSGMVQTDSPQPYRGRSSVDYPSTQSTPKGKEVARSPGLWRNTHASSQSSPHRTERKSSWGGTAKPLLRPESELSIGSPIQDGTPIHLYPSSPNGGRGAPLSPPPRPAPPTEEPLFLSQTNQSIYPHTSIQTNSSSRPLGSRNVSSPSTFHRTPLAGLGMVRTSTDIDRGRPSVYQAEYSRGSVDELGWSGTGDSPVGKAGKSGKTKKITPKKSSGVLRNLFGKKKDSASDGGSPGGDGIKADAVPPMPAFPSMFQRGGYSNGIEEQTRSVSLGSKSKQSYTPTPATTTTTPSTSTSSASSSSGVPTSLPNSFSWEAPAKVPPITPAFKLSTPPSPQISLPSFPSAGSAGFPGSDSATSLHPTSQQKTQHNRKISEISTDSLSSDNKPVNRSSELFKLPDLPTFNNRISFNAGLSGSFSGAFLSEYGNSSDSHLLPSSSRKKGPAHRRVLSKSSSEIWGSADSGRSGKGSWAGSRQGDVEKALDDLQLEVERGVAAEARRVGFAYLPSPPTLPSLASTTFDSSSPSDHVTSLPYMLPPPAIIAAPADPEFSVTPTSLITPQPGLFSTTVLGPVLSPRESSAQFEGPSALNNSTHPSLSSIFPPEISLREKETTSQSHPVGPVSTSSSSTTIPMPTSAPTPVQPLTLTRRRDSNSLPGKPTKYPSVVGAIGDQIMSPISNRDEPLDGLFDSKKRVGGKAGAATEGKTKEREVIKILTEEVRAKRRRENGVEVRDLQGKLEDCLQELRLAPIRAPIIRGVLLPILYDAERRGFDSEKVIDNKKLRAVYFEGLIMFVVKEIWLEQTPSERGAVLEAVASLIESPVLSIKALQSDPEDQAMFRKIMRTVISFVMNKLSSKGIFQNTLSFGGRILAFSFFRIEGIAQQLLAAMPISRVTLTRQMNVIAQVESTQSGPSYVHQSEPFPSYLLPFTKDDPRDYLASLRSTQCVYEDSEDEAAFRFPMGNWLRRWQSDDSELFFAFFRAYHKNLAKFYPSLGNPENPARLQSSVVLASPGYAHISAAFATKCLSYVQGKIVSVTTSAATNSFNSNETAGFGGSPGKPPVLESANRRLSDSVSYLLNTPMIVDPEFGTDTDGAKVWGNMSDIWTRLLVNRTNMYEPKGVFCLFDFLDSIASAPPDLFDDLSLSSSPTNAFSVKFIVSTLEIILRDGDHALTLCKCVSFIFQHWDSLTANPEDRLRVLGLLFDPVIFERLVLFWSQSVRSYVVRLLVFRLSHIKKRDGVESEPTEAELYTIKLLNNRLEAIRVRHGEIEPSVLGTILDEEEDCPSGQNAHGEDSETVGGGIHRSKSTIAMVPLIKQPSLQRSEEALSAPAKVEQLDARALSLTAESIPTDGLPSSPLGKATQWFKKSFGAKKKRSGAGKGMPSPTRSTLYGINEVSDDLEIDSDPYASPTKSTSTRSSMISTSASVPTGSTSVSVPPPIQTPVFLAPTTTSYKHDLSSPVRSSFESSSSSPLSSNFSDIEQKNFNQRPYGSSAVSARAPLNESSSGLATNNVFTVSTPESTSPDLSTAPAAHSGVFSFDFAQTPVSDSFDSSQLTSSGSSVSSAAGSSSNGLALAPGHVSATPRMSRSFSKRSSLLTPLASTLLERLAMLGEEEENASTSEKEKEKERSSKKGYDRKLHPYAIRMLAELEDTMVEYNEWFGPDGQGTLSGDGQPPRLTVGWSFHDEDD
ncbi:Uncharacterised protein family UPF0592 [Phaffia rhodozyma]|uniref:Uncharacterized protein family UPF0592 n=1 Tax=Phaffia rhodozyma TaxID=264483 RepID=A0A0F7SPZ0_PHARH|nr:Uncharacterised protein family UPF0592 [Phaffia rhodozyma]